MIIRVIIAIGTDLTQRCNETKIMSLLISELIILIALSLAPSSYLLIGTVLVLFVIVLQGRILRSDIQPKIK